MSSETTNGRGMHGVPGGDPDVIQLREIVALVWRRRRVVALAGALVLGAFAAFALLKVPAYRADGRVQVLGEESGLPGLAVDVPAATMPVDPVNSEVQVLRSRTLLDAVADSLVLQLTLGRSPLRRDSIFGELAVVAVVAPGEYILAYTDEGVALLDEDGATLARARAGEPVRAAGLRLVLRERPSDYPDEIRLELRDRREAGAEVHERLIARAVERTNLIDLSYTGNDPVLAADVVNAIMELGRRRSVERRREQASAKREFIRGQLTEFEAQLRQAQADVQVYQEQSGAVSLESQQAGQISNILAFERQVEELSVERQLYVPILKGLEAAGPADVASFEALSATPALVKNPAIADLYTRLVLLEVKRDSLVAGPGGARPDNPAVRAVQEQMRLGSAKLVDALREYMRGIDRQVGELRRTIAALKTQSEGLLPHAAELVRLRQRVEGLRKVYEALQTQLEQTRIEEASERGKLAIIDPAVVPRKPINATGLVDAVLALMLAGMLGLGSAFLVEHFDDRVRSPRQVSRELGYTVLGAVPWLPGTNGRVSREQSRVQLERLSAPAEAYRMIRVNVTFSHAVKPRKTMMVTSPGPGEGKTTTAVNLAAALAAEGKRTLLVDADLRRSNVHQLLGLKSDVGLSSVLAGQAVLEEAIARTDIEQLDVLPAGPHPPNPAELLVSERMSELLCALADNYHWVVVDAPPMLAVADPASLAPRADGVVMVVKADRTERHALVEAMERLAEVRGDVLGVVVNAFRPGRSEGRYYAYRDYHAHRDGERIGGRLRRAFSGAAGGLSLLVIFAKLAVFGL